MSVETVRDYLARWGKDKDIRFCEGSSATVELAAQELKVVPGRIAKSLSFYHGEGCVLLVAAGDARVDGGKYKAFFGRRPNMLSGVDVLAFTGHEVGGVCPFALDYERTVVYVDVSLQRFETIFPACGSGNSMIELTCDELFKYAQAKEWIDVCKLPTIEK